MGQIILVDMGLLRQGIQGESLFKVQINIPPDGGALAVASCGSSLCGSGQSRASHQADNQNFHICLADIFIARLLQLHLPEDVSQTGGNVQTFEMIQNTELAIGAVAHG